MSLYVQFGCGLCAPPGWENYDSSPTLRLQRLPAVGAAFRGCLKPEFPRNIRYGDVVRGLPVHEGSCGGLYSSHVLEHLALDDLRKALRNCLPLLKPGGRFRVVLPDLEFLVNQYQRSNAADACSAFMRDAVLGKLSRPRSAASMLRAWLGNAPHLWMWDYKGLSSELSSAGFREIRRASMGDSADPKFAEVEDPGRWENCLGIECVR